MSLQPLHEQIARIALGLPEAGHAALAGGGAMLAHDLVARPTLDIDLFTPSAEEVTGLAEALTDAMQGEGAHVEADRRGPSFTRLAVTMPDGDSVVVEVAHDARIRPPVRFAFGPVLHPDEVAADKTLALFGRAAARDLVDVEALSRRYDLDQLCDLAAEKDPGFDRVVLADALRAAAARPDTAFTELGLASPTIESLRAWAHRWRHHLVGTTAAVDSPSASQPRASPPHPRSTPPPSAQYSRGSSAVRPDGRGRDGPSQSL